MSLEADVATVRSAVALHDASHLAFARVGGVDAQQLVDRVSPRDLFVRAGQMLHTLLLDDDATPLADTYICCDEDDYLIVADGLDGAALAAYLGRHTAGLDATVTDLSPTHGALGLDGPYAWELLAEVTAPDVIGLPYLGFFHEGRFTCLRGGTTGEYGYHLLVERARLPEVREHLLAAGRAFDLRIVDPAALALCALEAGFFTPRRDVRPGLTPVELQLQWRLNAGRTYPGSSIVEARRREPRGRVALVVAPDTLTDDATVTLDGRPVGTILHAGRSFTRDEWLAAALLDRTISHPGITELTSGGVALRTISAPAINNRSLYVDPQRHSYATRHGDRFPSLLRPAWS